MSSIPVIRKPLNSLETGLNANNLASAASQRHPVDDLQRTVVSNNTYGDLEDVRRIYGSGLAMRLATERQMASQVGGRLPGMEATGESNVMLETLMGTDTKLTFGDFMSRPENLPVASISNPHTAMEHKLQL
mmetsp:Transcript_10019/g.14403  ORF Transcript_10019/g.14403 Transcript_10019/m.14403 type:complete len:132 (+) Transcript_10019:116-511(+)|eukprot:CAMPEP_0202447032 /NCGR_PEP_ID=MMETSP1360-20130828/5655_1 /ASSEMBLY_ACC=CAM_ASM_000848 /TAXON_ID=515479 /ORGANISM="Licmophora paradoxa, Strain CCMP2313" /LENGTH=131 /DNA_ID=CAMNT_0049063859 /DNA_START=111 /DNA_END=506 /DNA_ORIENTATION=+